MNSRQCTGIARRILLWVATGSVLLSGSCSRDLRDSIYGAGVDFVGATAGAVLEALFPVDPLLNPGG